MLLIRSPPEPIIALARPFETASLKKLAMFVVSFNAERARTTVLWLVLLTSPLGWGGEAPEPCQESGADRFILRGVELGKPCGKIKRDVKNMIKLK